MKESTYVAACLVVLAVRLDPVQPERVQERRQALQKKNTISAISVSPLHPTIDKHDAPP